MDGVGFLLAVCLVVLAVFVGLFYLVWRRRRLVSGGGAFECYQRKAGVSEKTRWRHGIVRYQRDAVVWFPLLSVGFKPGCTIPRLRVQITPGRPPTAVEQGQLTDGQAIVGIAAQGGEGPAFEWAIAPSAVNGLLAWAEAAPPGEGQYGETRRPSLSVELTRRTSTKRSRS